MAGHHAVVVVPGEDEGRGVLRVGVLLDVVEGGDAHQVGELLLHVAAAVVAHPGVAHRELVEPGENWRNPSGAGEEIQFLHLRKSNFYI